MKRLNLVKLRQSLTNKLRQNPNKRGEIEPELDQVNSELAALDMAENKTLNSTLSENWLDDNYTNLEPELRNKFDKKNF